VQRIIAHHVLSTPLASVSAAFRICERLARRLLDKQRGAAIQWRSASRNQIQCRSNGGTTYPG
jgi:hypothetical protein